MTDHHCPKCDEIVVAIQDATKRLKAELAHMSEGDTHLSNTLGSAKKDKVETRTVVKVERVKDDAIRIPEGMSLETLDKVIHARMEFENKTVAIAATIETPFIFEAAYALHAVLTERFGWTDLVDTPGFFGPEPPTMLSVPVGPGKPPVQVPWGRFKLPGVDGYLESGATRERRGGPLVFQISGEVKRRDEDKVNELVESIRKYVKEQSIYRNQAFAVALTDDDGNDLPLPQPKFLTLDPAVEAELILPESTEASVEANVFVFIEQTAMVRKQRIPLKRGILLAGEFGTGKTMVAHATASKAIRNGWTYIVCEKPDELAEVIRLARAYQPSVVFCEDIDRVMRGDDRSIGTDQILNVIDGVESKGTELMVVLTTNEIDKVTTAMLRPGRLDAVIHIGPPDAAAAERLMRQYGRGLIADDVRLTKAGKELEGNIPAVIREVVEKSKAYAIREAARIAKAAGQALDINTPLSLTDEALYGAAVEMREHRNRLAPKLADERSETVKAADLIATAMKETGIVAPFPVRTAQDTLTHKGDWTELPDGHATN